MEKYFEKVADLKFDRITILNLIEKIDDLKAIFSEEIKLPFNILYTLAKEGKLNEKTDEILTSIFEELISTKQEYADRYLHIFNTNYGSNEVEPSEVKTRTKTKVEVVETESKLPRRYGKEKIEQDIANQGGVATPVQRAMLKVNDLKNIYVNLQARGVKSMVGGQNVLTDEECRKIQAVVTTVERQLKEILKKK